MIERVKGEIMSQGQAKTGNTLQKEVATLGGGCFWSMEAIFKETKGVEQVHSGYSGGTLADPTYEKVLTGTTGHAEVVQIRFDPNVISFKEILEIFFTAHDPTTLNRQGPDVGPQYRSVIFYHNNEQKAIAEKIINDLDSRIIWDAPIVTQIKPFKTFYKSEEYHDDYCSRNPEQPYCRLVITPKIIKFREQHRNKLKSTRVLE